MQDLLTLALESLATFVTLVMFLDFASGLMYLYNASATTFQDKPEEATAVESIPTDPKETLPLDDPWTAEVEELIKSFPCYAVAPKTVYLLPPTVLEEASQKAKTGQILCPVYRRPDTVDYSGWTIRALKKEAQNRKLSKYSSLTKNQLISRLTAA